MANINILDTVILSSYGDLDETLRAIKDENIKTSKIEIDTLDGVMSIPYFLFEDKIKEDTKSIYDAMKKIIKQLTDKLSPLQKKETALIIGTSQIDLNIINSIKATIYEQKEYKSQKLSIDTYAKDISKNLGLNGYTMTIATACTSSANAILEAKNLIQNDVFKYVVVLGIEIFSTIMSNGFSSMKLLSCSTQKPFDKNRDGLVLGEALAGVLIGLDKSLWSLEGGYSNCNSLNITSASENGDDFREVIEIALESLNLKPNDITALKTHSTSTLANDLAEINAISKVFCKDIVFTALKPYFGHTLGACGLLELVVFMAAIDDGFIPKTINSKEYIMNHYKPLSEDLKCKSGLFMLNYFGFGGNNVSLIIKKKTL